MSVTRTMVCRYFMWASDGRVGSLCPEGLPSTADIRNGRRRTRADAARLAVSAVVQVAFVEHRAIADADTDLPVLVCGVQARPARVPRGVRPGEQSHVLARLKHEPAVVTRGPVAGVRQRALGLLRAADGEQRAHGGRRPAGEAQLNGAQPRRTDSGV